MNPKTHTTHQQLPDSVVFKLPLVRQKQYVLQLYSLWNFFCSTFILYMFADHSEGDVPTNRLAIAH